MLADQKHKKGHIDPDQPAACRSTPREDSGEDNHSRAYLRYLKKKKQDRWAVRLSQILIFVVFLIAWEVAARTHLVNPMLTSYPSAIWPTFLELLNTTDMNQQGNII